MGNTVIVHPVTRIEGHARVVLDINDQGGLDKAHMQVLEIRGFEKLLEGMELLKMPQMTARLCGVCPAAHHLVATLAIERGMSFVAPSRAKALRDLLYAGHILHSHALSNFVLTGPDLLAGLDAPADQRNVFSLLKVNPELSKKLLRVRSIGQRVVELVGGRGVHPVAAIPGGMSFEPTADNLALIAKWGHEATELLEELNGVMLEKLAGMQALRDAATFHYSSMALSNDGVVDFLDGDWVVVDADGAEARRFNGADYGNHMIEHVMPGSYMKSVMLKGAEEQPFFVGPLARLNVNRHMSTPKANAAAQHLLADGIRCSAVDFIEARLIDMLHCAERMAELADNLPDGAVRSELPPPAAGRYVAAIEAPRGILVHDFTTDDSGRITAVNLIVATQNNYNAIDESVTALAKHFLDAGEDQLINGVEFAIRCFDPCLACATHTAGRMPLVVEFRRGGETVRSITRGGQS
jgi:F420-non-reducing hydrogenase large subunit